MANLRKTPPFPLFIALFSHPFYTFFKRIFEQSRLPVSVRHLHLLECSALLLYLFRLASLAIQLYLGSQMSSDPLVAYFASQPQLYDRYMLACVVCLILYTLIINWQLFLGQKRTKPNNRSISWQGVAYDLTVRNLDQARRCRRLAKRSHLVLSQADSKLAYLRLLYTTIRSDLFQTHLDLGKLAHPRYRLSIFSFLSVGSRKKCLQFQFACNLIARVLPIFGLLVFLLGLTMHLILGVHATPGATPPLGWLLLLTDLTLLWIFAFLFYRSFILIIYFVIITSLAIRWHLQAGNRLLTYLMAKGRSSPLQGLSTWNRLLLGNFLSEHAQICALLDASNRQFISLALFSTFLLHAPTNIYLIYRLIYLQLLFSEFIILLAFTFGQIFFISGAVVPLIWANSALYRTAQYLPALQLYVLRGGSNRPLKFKYEILQSTLTESRVKSGATIGPLCLITFESLYKILTLYAVYMLAFFNLLPK